MNKKNITLVLVGFLMILFQFHIKIGPAAVDLFHDTVGYVLILIAMTELALRSKLFKKVRKFAFMGIASSLFVQFLNTLDFTEYAASAETVKYGINVFVFIYATYYFTQALILEAQDQNCLAAVKNFQVTWMVFGGSLFLNFIALMSGIGNLSIIVTIISYLAGLHYAYTTYTACSSLYTENMPKHIDTH